MGMGNPISIGSLLKSSPKPPGIGMLTSISPNPSLISESIESPKLPENSSWFNVLVYNKFCQTYDSVFVEVKDVFCDKNSIIIPNAFSPNEDNKNDYYRIIDKDGIITSFKLEIFNRFGEKVYSSENVNDKWDGCFKSVLLSTQIFDYYLEIECLGEKSLFEKGNIT